MKNWKIFNLLLFAFAASWMVFMSLLQLQPEYLSFHGLTYHVAISNGFSRNSSLPLVIWCTTLGDGQMGGRALQEGDDFSWNVRVSFWMSKSKSSSACTIKWDQKRREFEAFGDGWRCGPLKKCLWLVKEDGFYFSNDDNNWIKEFSWP